MASINGAAASKAIRKHFSKLSVVVTVGDIPAKLYQEEVIESLENVCPGTGKTEKEKGYAILSLVQKAIKVDPELFETFCTILDEEDDHTRQWSQRVKDAYKTQLRNLEKKERVKKLENPEYDRLKEDLSTFVRNREHLPLEKSVNARIQSYIESALESDVEEKEIRKQFETLCVEELIIPTDIRESALEAIDEAIARNKPSDQAESPSVAKMPQRPSAPPLFSKDALYHASLCCHTVSACSRRNFSGFLSRYGHTLKEASFSMDCGKFCQYLIAAQKDTLYVAFQSEATIADWLKKYSSFDDGLKKQTKQIPLHFFVEQILKTKKVVLTGFSFGGMLACYAAACIWKMASTSTNVLEKNMICITFGQPLIPLPLLEEAIAKFPQLAGIIHQVFHKDDLLPSLMHLFWVGCAQRSKSPTLRSTSEAVMKTGFEAPFAAKFLSSLAKLQTLALKTQSYSTVVTVSNVITPEEATAALATITASLQEALKLGPKSCALFGNCYIMSSKASQGLAWNCYAYDLKAAKNPATTELLASENSLKSLETTTVFKKHTMEEYRQNMFRSHLDKDPDRFLPPASEPSDALPELGILQPQVENVEFHTYPDEFVVVLQGNNLCFSCMVTFNRKDSAKICEVLIPAKSTTRYSIQLHLAADTKPEDIITKSGVVIVHLHNQFTAAVETEIIPKEEPFSFSLRQVQLAKHTPSQLIELAYSIAMLERQSDVPKGHQLPMSKRYMAIVQFLEEAATIVPLESIFDAIVYGNDKIAIKCAKALKDSNIALPFSLTTLQGSMDAAIRLITGLPVAELDSFDLQELRSTLHFEIMQKLHPQQSQQTPMLIPGSAVVTSQGFRGATYSEVTRSSSSPSPPPGLGEIPFPFQIDVVQLFQFSMQQMVHFQVQALPENPLNRELAEYIKELYELCLKKLPKVGGRPESLYIISKKTIEHLYPTSQRRQTKTLPPLQSPIEVLKDARQKLATFVEESQEDLCGSLDARAVNEEMLQLVKDIHGNKLKLCTALLAGFMEHQVQVPLLDSAMNTASKVYLSSSAPVAMGVWVMYSMSFQDLQDRLSSSPGDALVVEIKDYISGIFDSSAPPCSDRRYAAKLQFLLQGIRKTVSCSTQYISYSLEHQLCRHLKFDKTIPVKELVSNWDTIFKGDALSLVAKTHRPVIARWLKWALLVHDLREVLAGYTCIGVIGLLNSGKSQLVNSLFKIETLVGTTKTKKTTVPFLYNLDGKVEGLDVIDFPGVDDKDTVRDLAKLLVGMAQVVIFVVDYRKITSEPAIEWLEQLAKEDIPVLVCLTYADRLYAELARTTSLDIAPKMNAELDSIKKTLRPYGNIARALKFCCFAPDTSLTAEQMKEVEINSPFAVGCWLVDTFQSMLNQKDLAEKLLAFIQQDS